LCLQAIKLDKVDAGSHYLLATVFNEQGKIDEAINSINNTLFLEPDFALGHFFLGNISMNAKRKNESKKHFSNALKSLDKLKPDEIIAESEGLTAGRLVEIINSLK
jgi:chemotaxis protein methyltransferase CheR